MGRIAAAAQIPPSPCQSATLRRFMPLVLAISLTFNLFPPPSFSLLPLQSTIKQEESLREKEKERKGAALGPIKNRSLTKRCAEELKNFFYQQVLRRESAPETQSPLTEAGALACVGQPQ